MRKSKIVTVVTAGLLAGSLAAASAPAMADPTNPAAPPYRELVGVGADSTAGVMNAMSEIIRDTVGTKILASYDPAPAGSQISTKPSPVCQNIPRPSSSDSGVAALVNDRITNPGNGCIQFARSTVDNSASFPGAGLTWIPFAVDGLAFVTRSDSTIPRNLGSDELTKIYNCAVPGTYHPVLPGFGSEVRARFLAKLGFTDGPDFVTRPAHTCVRDTNSFGRPVAENVGLELVDSQEIIPYAVGSYLAQFSTVVPDVHGRTILDNVNSVASGTPNNLAPLSAAGGGLTYMIRSDSVISRNLTVAQLAMIYNCGGPAAPTIPASERVRPVLPQFGSQTRREFLSQLGLTDSADFVTSPGHTCIRDTKIGGGPVAENSGLELVDSREIGPYRIKSYLDQISSLEVADVHGRAVLGNVNGIVSIVVNTSAPYQHNLYNVVPSELLGTEPYHTTFVGPGSVICANTAIINRYGFTKSPYCGNTDRGSTSGRTCPPVPEYPTSACTGVPPGTQLVTLPNNVDGVSYNVRTSGTILDGVHITGDLVIQADNVIVRNSLIDGSVVNNYVSAVSSFSIIDSTVGPATGCLTAPAVGEGDYSALRVYVRNHGDGFRAASDNVIIRDSYVDLCSNPGDHSDGVQSFTDGRNLIFDHNTVDQRGVVDMNAPIFIGDGWSGVSVTNNLVAGGTYSIEVYQLAGPAVVRGNRVVDKTWVYGPVSSECDDIDWSDNQLVQVDATYRVTAIVSPVACY